MFNKTKSKIHILYIIVLNVKFLIVKITRTQVKYLKK